MEKKQSVRQEWRSKCPTSVASWSILTPSQSGHCRLSLGTVWAPEDRCQGLLSALNSHSPQRSPCPCRGRGIILSIFPGLTELLLKTTTSTVSPFYYGKSEAHRSQAQMADTGQSWLQNLCSCPIVGCWESQHHCPEKWVLLYSHEGLFRGHHWVHAHRLASWPDSSHPLCITGFAFPAGGGWAVIKQ